MIRRTLLAAAALAAFATGAFAADSLRIDGVVEGDVVAAGAKDGDFPSVDADGV